MNLWMCQMIQFSRFQTEVIKSLRQAGFQGFIMVEGNSWSGLHSWTTDTWTSTDGKNNLLKTPLYLLARILQKQA